jgi:hypothetical protein
VVPSSARKGTETLVVVTVRELEKLELKFDNPSPVSVGLRHGYML